MCVDFCCFLSWSFLYDDLAVFQCLKFETKGCECANAALKLMFWSMINLAISAIDCGTTERYDKAFLPIRIFHVVISYQLLKSYVTHPYANC